MGTSQSPVDTFSQRLSYPIKPGAGQAIHKALAGVDVNKLGAFNDAFLRQCYSNPNGSLDSVLIAALRGTNGTDNKTNIDFAKKIQAAFKAVDALPDVTPPGMSQSVA